MRLLGLLLWCFIISVVQSVDPPKCNMEMPVNSPSCTEIIRWMHRDDKEATSTCLEYFPTTFLKGESNDVAKTEIKCTVYRQFQCNHMPNSISMFDKCYTFSKKEITMKDYIDNGHKSFPDEPEKEICGAKGALPVFFTLSQGKHIAMAAHRLGIEKIWVNLDKDGKTIDEPTNEESKRVKKDFLLYKNLWKVHDEVYWNGENLEITPKDTKEGPNKGKPILPANVKYLFFRSRTDYVHNLYQGSFERVKENSATKASVACEYPAKVVPDLRRYCEKMGEKGLGLNAKYDDLTEYDSQGTAVKWGRKRCVYTTLSKFSLKGNNDAIKDLTSCKESPSNEHKAGLDDGTANKGVYDKLTAKGTYRVAAVKANDPIDYNNAKFAGDARTKCQSSAPTQKQRLVYRIYDHFENMDFSSKMTSPWNPAYPKAECSDFPNGENGDSNTLAIQNGKVIDVPVPVRLNAICSIEANRDCELNEDVCKNLKNANGLRKGLICHNAVTWNKETNLYAECKCGKFHKEDRNDCAWDTTELGTEPMCGAVRRYNSDAAKEDWFGIKIEQSWKKYAEMCDGCADKVVQAVVRNGCWLRAWSHPDDPVANPQTYNYKLIDKKYGSGDDGNGVYIVPQHDAGTSNGWEYQMSTSAVECECTDPK